MVIPFGAMLNALFIVVGGALGMSLGAKLPESVRRIVFQGLGLCILCLGIKMAFESVNLLVVIFSIVLGSVTGDLAGLEARMTRAGDWCKKRFHSGNPRFTEGMVSASALFCIGAMAILGSFDEGLRGDRTVVLTKAVLDGFLAVTLSSVYGVGVLFSSIAVLIYQGALTMCAGIIQPWLEPVVMNELIATGGVMIVGIGLNLLEVTRIPLTNMMPALIFSVVLAILSQNYLLGLCLSALTEFFGL